MTAETADVVADVFLAAGIAGFTVFGCCLVYLISDAESLTPVWLERAVLLALNARDRARRALIDALLVLLLRLNAPVSAPKGAPNA